MPTKRKTVKVSDLAERVNGMLATSDDDKREAREALAMLLERVLMDTNNHRGFYYLNSVDGDQTRRHYYYHADND